MAVHATKTLEYIKMENWHLIEKGKRDKREVIQAEGDAYMDMWSSETAHLDVPWGTPCVRLEGSAYTGMSLHYLPSPTNFMYRPNVVIGRMSLTD